MHLVSISAGFLITQQSGLVLTQAALQCHLSSCNHRWHLQRISLFYRSGEKATSQFVMCINAHMYIMYVGVTMIPALISIQTFKCTSYSGIQTMYLFDHSWYFNVLKSLSVFSLCFWFHVLHLLLVSFC